MTAGLPLAAAVSCSGGFRTLSGARGLIDANANVTSAVLQQGDIDLAPTYCDSIALTNSCADQVLVEFWAWGAPATVDADDETISDLYVLARPSSGSMNGIATYSPGNLSPAPKSDGTLSSGNPATYVDYDAWKYQRPYHRLLLPSTGSNWCDPLRPTAPLRSAAAAAVVVGRARWSTNNRAPSATSSTQAHLRCQPEQRQRRAQGLQPPCLLRARHAVGQQGRLPPPHGSACVRPANWISRSKGLQRPRHLHHGVRLLPPATPVAPGPFAPALS